MKQVREQTKKPFLSIFFVKPFLELSMHETMLYVYHSTWLVGNDLAPVYRQGYWRRSGRIIAQGHTQDIRARLQIHAIWWHCVMTTTLHCPPPLPPVALPCKRVGVWVWHASLLAGSLDVWVSSWRKKTKSMHSSGGISEAGGILLLNMWMWIYLILPGIPPTCGSQETALAIDTGWLILSFPDCPQIALEMLSLKHLPFPFSLHPSFVTNRSFAQ